MAYKFNKITVLIVEDTQEMFEITRAVLQTFGINSTISANDLRSGWRKFCNYNPDLVIIDWLENGMLEEQGVISDGLKLMHAIRHDDKSPNKFVPAIMSPVCFGVPDAGPFPSIAVTASTTVRPGRTSVLRKAMKRMNSSASGIAL